MGAASNLFILLVVISSSTHVISGAHGKTLMCYFGSWSTYRWSTGKFDVENIDPFLCTHLVFGFAGLDAQNFTIQSLDPFNDLEENWGKGAFKRFTGLKKVNPQLKALLAIGGWNEGCTKYSEMAKNSQRRATFIQSALDMVLKHEFDGLDLDWEYPGGRDDSPGLPEDKKNFGLLLQEMRPVFDQHGLLLTAAVSAGKGTIDKAYDVPVMRQTLDFINVMTYDYHGWWGNHTFTGHNSPLYARPDELTEDSPGYQMNTDFSIRYWMSQGASPQQILLGMGAYGRGFNLVDGSNHGLYAPASSGIDPGMYTSARGFWGYNEFCEKMRTEHSQWTTVRENDVVAPYAYNNLKWFGYDDEHSVAIKTQYLKELELGGAMVWSIDTDDFNGFCTGKKFGIISTIRDVLFDGHFPTAPTTISPPETTPSSKPSPTTTPNQDDDSVCHGHLGPQPDPLDCQKYYVCYYGPSGDIKHNHETCDQGLLFDKVGLYCDWDYNVDCEDIKEISNEDDDKPNLGFTCPSEGFFPDGTCTNHFYECVRENGYLTAYEFYCPPTLVFDHRIDNCNYPHLVPECDDYYSTTTTTTTTTITTTTTSTTTSTTTATTSMHGNDICKKPGLNPDPHHPRNCNIYYSCRPAPNYPGHWLITECHCKDGLAFDPEIEVCSWPDSIDDCSPNEMYYFLPQDRAAVKLFSKSAALELDINSPDECIARHVINLK